VLIATAFIFTLYHTVLTSLVISASEELDLRFSYIFGVELLAFLPVAITMLVIIWVSKVSPKLFSTFRFAVVSFHLLMALGLFVVHAIWQTWINHQFFLTEFNIQEITDDFMAFLVMRFFLYIIIIGLVGGMVKLRENRIAANKSTQLQLELQKAKLKEIELKMNPEIIYPNLGYIKDKAGESPELASQMVILMAGLLRKLVDNLESEKIKLSDDIQFFQMYVNMINLRLERVVETEVDIRGMYKQKRVPSMILLVPLFEELFFGKYSSYMEMIDKIEYQAVRIDSVQSNIKLIFSNLSTTDELQDYLDEEHLIQTVNNQLSDLSSSSFSFNAIVEKNSLILMMSIFTRYEVGVSYV
jgi:hypothetical protein